MDLTIKVKEVGERTVLLELQGVTTAVLANLEIPSDTYREIRIIVESASVVLVDGYTFDDGTTESDLSIPSGAQTGLKLKLRSGDSRNSPILGSRVKPCTPSPVLYTNIVLEP